MGYTAHTLAYAHMYFDQCYDVNDVSMYRIISFMYTNMLSTRAIIRII